MLAGIVQAAAARDPRRPDLPSAGPRPPLPVAGPGRPLLVAEIKPVSPAEGRLGAGDPVARARAYARGGADAISVLTEPTRFGGSLDLLARIAAEVDLPLLAKDVHVSPVQVEEAVRCGASAVLLVARAVDAPALARLTAHALAAGATPLVEVFDEADLASLAALRAALGPEGARRLLVGVNARDLRTLHLDPGRHARLLPRLGGLPALAASGLDGPVAVAARARMGYRAVLVGTVLMRAPEPAAAVAAMAAALRGAGRAA